MKFGKVGISVATIYRKIKKYGIDAGQDIPRFFRDSLFVNRWV